MKRMLLSAILLGLAAGTPAATAQQAVNDSNPLILPVVIHQGTIFIPPLPGIPFSAKAIDENRMKLPDGAIATYHNVHIIARDSRGRVHWENPPYSEISIYDPQSHVMIRCDMASHIALRTVFVAEPPPPLTQPSVLPRDPLVKVEDLGTSEMENLQVEGTRASMTIPASKSGTGVPVTIVEEKWWSKDLHLHLLVQDDDPRAGHLTIALSDLKQGEPDAALFEIPADFKVVDAIPPPPPNPVRR